MKKPAVVFATLLLVGGCDSFPWDRVDDLNEDTARLIRFNSCNEMRAALRVGPDGFRGGVNVGDGAPLAENDANSSPGETNIQVAGVDEIDNAKAIGDFIYRVSDTGKLQVLRRLPVGEAAVVQEVDIDDGRAFGLFVTSDRVVVLSQGAADEVPPGSSPGEMPDAMRYGSWYGSHLSWIGIHTFERKEDGSVELLGFREIGSYFSAARMAEGRIYVVTQGFVGSEIDTGVPVEEALPVSKAGSEEDKCGCGEVWYEPASFAARLDPPGGNNLVCVWSLGIDDADSAPGRECVLTSYASTVYASTGRLFVATGGWHSMGRTPIHQFALGASPRYVGTAITAGLPLNQFSLDEYDGHLRVATTLRSGFMAAVPLSARDGDLVSSRTSALDDGSLVSVFRLSDEEDPALVGRVSGIAPGEELYAVRFLGDKGFIVTFEVIDPLFALDLSDPENPTVRGELKIPGYSTYLHPMADGYLLGVGVDDDLSGMALSIFDVSDLDSPSRLHQIAIGKGYSWSEALWDHKAFRFIPETDQVVFPVEVYSTSKVFSGFHIYSASVEDGFRRVGTSEAASGNAYGGRSFFREGNISLVGGGELVIRGSEAPDEDLLRLAID